MTNPIAAVGTPTPNIAAIDSLPLLGGPTKSEGTGTDFGKMLADALQQTSDLATSADARIQDHLVGNDNSTLAEVFTEVKKADLAMRTMIQIRNKLMEAYREVQQLRM